MYLIKVIHIKIRQMRIPRNVKICCGIVLKGIHRVYKTVCMDRIKSGRIDT